MVKKSEAGEDERQQHHRGLSDEKQTPLVDAIGDDPAEEGDEEERNLAGEADDTQPECGVREGKDEPALGNILHPAPDIGGEVAGPEEAEIGISQGSDHLRKLRAFRFWRSLCESGGLVAGSGEVLLVEFGSGMQGELRKLV